MDQKPLRNLLIKPAGADCNLRCGYCFYLEKCHLYPDVQKHRMDGETLSSLIQQMMILGGAEPSFGWQGGEPTLMGLDFFRQVIALQKRFGQSGQKVGNGLQTNGYVINEEWADFLAEYQFLVGLSLDGPQHVHDHYRLTGSGAGSWERVVQSSRTLLGRGVAVNSLVVVNDYSASFPEEIYDFLRAEGYDYLQFIPAVEESLDGQAAAPFSLSPQAFGEFFCRIFDKWMADFQDGWPTVSVRWFDSLLHTYVGLTAPECPMQEECGVYLCIEHNGDVYPCDFFVEKELRLGNVNTDRMDMMLNSPKMEVFAKAKRRLPPECATCPWLARCFGGCVKDRIKDPRDEGSNHFCEGYKIFFAHADRSLRQLAERWKKKQAHEEALARKEATAAAAAHSKPLPTSRPPGRNDPCPCGSMRKYKKCCGRLVLP